MSSGQAAALLTRFGSVLTREDHLYRFRRLVLRERRRMRVDPGGAARARATEISRKAVIAVLDRKKDAGKLLRGVASEFLADPLYVFGRMHLLLRAGQPIEAARFLHRVDARHGRCSGDGDIWWEERRTSRACCSTAARPISPTTSSQRRSRKAKAIRSPLPSMPAGMRCDSSTTRSRPSRISASCTASRPCPARRRAPPTGSGARTRRKGSTEAARLDYVEAARFGGTFYGQLAREKLGMLTTGLERMPRPSALDRLRFADREMVKVVRLLASAGHAERALPVHPRARRDRSTRRARSRSCRRWRAASAARMPASRAAAMAEERGLAVGCLPALFFGVPPELAAAGRASTARSSMPSCGRRAPSTTPPSAMSARAD